MEFFKEWGTLFVAVLALSQPALIFLWKKYFRKGHIDIYNTGKIEIGYSTFGTTIGLWGTLRTIHRDFFISSIHLNLLKQKDRSQHKYEWAVFRNAKMLSSGGPYLLNPPKSEVSLELPSGFMLSTAQPHHFNILFFDALLKDEIQTCLSDLIDDWRNNHYNPMLMKLFEKGTYPEKDHIEIARLTNDLYSNFLKQKHHTDAFTSVDRLCYWEPCRYTVNMEINTSRPDLKFEQTWDFELLESDTKSLRVNAVHIMSELLGVSFPNYHFSFANYLNKSK